MSTSLPQLKRVLFVGTVWPEPRSSAAGLRTLGLIHVFLKEGWEIHFVSPSVEKEFTHDLQKLGLHTRSQQANDSDFDSYVAELQPDVVVYDRFIMEEQFGWRVRENSPETLNILDTSDLHFLRRSRQQALKENQSLDTIFKAAWNFSNSKSPGHEDFLREVASIYRCDLTLMISDFELQLLTERFKVPKELLLHLPFLFASTRLETDLSFRTRENFVSIGNYRHPPNADGIRWLKEKIWPLIKKELPRAEVHLYGAYPSREMMDLNSPKLGFHVNGPVDHAIDTLKRFRVNLAALRFGAGIKGKIADGWSAGTPVVTTPIGAEGMVIEGRGFAGLVAYSEQEFAQHCVDVYRDPLKWDDLRLQGVDAFNELFDEAKNAKIFLNAVVSIQNNLEHHRSQNLVGLMLRHHLHQSTKYFSRWIEAKNRV